MFAMTFTPGGTMMEGNLDTPEFVKEKLAEKSRKEQMEAERLALLAEQVAEKDGVEEEREDEVSAKIYRVSQRTCFF